MAEEILRYAWKKKQWKILNKLEASGKNIIYTAADFSRYHSGSMSEAEMHALEKAALEDPFLSDALDGYIFTSTHEEDIADLRSRLLEKEKKKDGFIFSSWKTMTWMRVAAALILIPGTIFLALNISHNKKTNLIADKAVIKNIEPLNNKDSFNVPNGTVQNQVTVTSDMESLKVDKKLSGNNLNKDFAGRGISQKKVATSTLHLEQDQANTSAYTLSDAATQAPLQEQLAKPTNASPQKKAFKYILSGRIIDVAGKPLPFVSVMDKKENNNTMTDTSGRFSIASNDSILPASIAAVGYNSVEKSLDKNRDQLIVLTPAEKQLSEVVVTGMGVSRQSKELGYSTAKVKGNVSEFSAKEAEPVTGKLKFYEDLNDSIKKSFKSKPGLLHGTVILSFFVRKNGTLKKIKVEKTLCTPCDEEAIRLLLAGPKWTYVDDKRTSVTINF